MKKVMLVVIASLIALVAIQFASTASSSTKASPLARKVAALAKDLKKTKARVSSLEGFAGCLVSQNAGPFGVTRFPAATLPSGGYLDLTPSGGSPTYISVRVDPQCLSSSKSPRLKPQYRFSR